MNPSRSIAAASRRLAPLGLLFALVSTTLAPSRGAAQEGPTEERWLLNVDAAAIAPLSAPQRDRFRPGVIGGATLLRSLRPKISMGLRVQGGVLFDGPAPADPRLEDPGHGTLSQLHLALRLRPLGRSSDPSRLGGLFLEASGGAGLTGSDVRMSVAGALGWGFEAGAVTVAPVLRYVWVHQPAGNLETTDAHLLALGLEIGFFDGRATAAPEPEPEPSDRDGDGFPDDTDECPDEAEDFDAFVDDDGCPEPDNDRDGILDTDDECPLEHEDMDGYQDDDGCPDEDNDLDGFADSVDACPNDAEVVNGVDDADGCPDEGLIEMIDDRVVLEERVLFDFQRSRVKSRAKPVIDAIVELVRQHPEWTEMRVEGHADVRGRPGFNQSLSVRRARNTVEALVEAGMPQDRVEYVGYGATRPRDLRHTEEAHQRNRRVEFVVIQRRELTDEEIEAREREAAAQRGAIEEAR